MKLSSLLSTLTKKRSAKANDRNRSFRRRFMIEALEDRRVLATFTVDTVADSGTGSLRQAIINANSTANVGGADTIEFKIPGAGVHTISPLTQLDAITEPVIINGYTQPLNDGSGNLASPNTNGPRLGDNAVIRIEIEGSQAGNLASGLNISAGNCQISGLAINRFQVGVFMSSANGNVVAGNFIGTDPTGEIAEGNNYGILTGGNGAAVVSNSNTIGGLDPALRNVVSGNGYANIYLLSNDNLIVGNFVGTDAKGTKALSTAAGFRSGVFVLGNNNVIGGTEPNARNVISGNSGGLGWGIEVNAGQNHLIQGNYIGTDVTGTVAVANNIGIQDSIGGIIGGPTATPGTGAGNLISGNTQIGLSFGSATAQGNLIGTDYTGKIAIGNGRGVYMEGATLGGTTIGARNIISGNTDSGVFAVYGGNVVQGNYIGTDITGTIAIGNKGTGGIYVLNGQNDLIGGTSPGARNVVARNGFNEIYVGNSPGPVVIQGNYIGVDMTGNVPMGNLSNGGGITAVASSNVQIGGSSSDARNVIGGRSAGISISSSSSNFTIQGNSIGIGADGHTPVSNGYGIWIYGGSTNTLIGGKLPGEGNVIAENNSLAIVMSQYYLAPITTRNAVLGNSIYNNYKLGPNDPAGLGIDINRQDLGNGADGPNPNDLGDTDVGNNDLQNYPVITNVINGNGSTTIQGTLNSTPNSTFRVEFFSNSTVKVNGYSEGKTYLGFKDVTTDVNGNVSFNVPLTTPSTSGMYISSTATNSGNNTSEFSLAYYVPVNLPPTAKAGGPYSVGEGVKLLLDGSQSTDPVQASSTLTYAWDLDGDGIYGETGSAAAHGDEMGRTPLFDPKALDGPTTAPISLKVTNSKGLFSIANGVVNIDNVNPVPTINGAPATSAEATAIAVTGTATDANANDQANLTLSWSVTKNGVNYGAIGSGANYSFTPDDNGTFVVSLKATDKDGGNSTVSKSITVTNVAPTAVFSLTTSSSEGSIVSVSSSSTDPSTVDKTSLTLSWSVTKNGIAFAAGGGATGSNFIFSPDDNGTYVVTLKATDKDGGTSTIIKSISIVNVAPIATFNAPVIVVEGASITLTLDSVVDPSSADISNSFRYSFAFDGKDTSLATTYATALTLSNKSSSFPTLGTYTVKAKVFDKDGGSTTYTKDIIVMRAKQFGTSNDERVTGTAVNSTGTYVLGYTTDSGGNVLGSFVRKYDTSGVLSWDKPSFGIASAIAVDFTSVYVTGYIYTSQKNYEIIVFKLNASNGKTGGLDGWTKQYGTPEADYANAIAVDTSGIYIAGLTYGSMKGTSTGSADAFILKFAKDGATVKVIDQFGTTAYDGATGLAVYSTEVYLIGETSGALKTGARKGGDDIFIRKYDGTGVVKWTNQFGTFYDDRSTGIAVDSTGVYAVGNSGDDGFIRQFDNNGNEKWANNISSGSYYNYYSNTYDNYYDTASAVGVDTTGIYVVGSTQGFLPGAMGTGNSYIQKYKADGSVLWTNQLGDGSDRLTSIAIDATGVSIGGNVFLGSLYGTNAGGVDGFVLKLKIDKAYIGASVKVINGYLTGATAFFDANLNGVLDSDEPSTLTSSTGDFDLQVPAIFDANGNGVFDDNEGQWVVFGGIDSSTGLTAVDQLVAPASFSVVTPLTTLVSTLTANYGLATLDAETRVLQSLGLPNIDLSGLDPIAGTLAGDANASKIFAAHAAIQDTIAQGAAIISGAGNSVDTSKITSTLFAEIAARILQPDSVIDFSQAIAVQSLLVSAANDVAITLTDAIVYGAATVIAGTNKLLADLSVTTDLAYLSQVAQIKTVSQGAVATVLKSAAAGNTAIQTVVDNNTGAALATQVAAAVPLPTIARLNDIFIQATGNDGVIVNFSPSAVDFAGHTVNVASVPASGSLFPVGDTLVTSTATDSQGNSRSMTFTVHVGIPNVAPVVHADQNVVVVEMGHTATVTGTYLDINAKDQLHLSASIGNISQPAGTTGVWTWTLDANSKSVSDTVIITLNDQSGESSAVSFNLVVINHLPVANAGGPYTVNEGSSLNLDGSKSSDPDQDSTTLTYLWDLDGDGVYGETGANAGRGDETGMSPLFSSVGLDGPSTFNVALRVIDDSGATANSAAVNSIISVANVAPTVSPIIAQVEPVAVTTIINASANFTDPGLADTHTAVWNWGDGSTSIGAVVESNGSGAVSGSHSYAAAGVYTITLTVTDDDGGSGQSVFQYVVAYDPSAGFVTGGGWINSPAGAYAANSTLTGKANFGFESKYNNGNSVPTGNTEFQFSVANFKFKSTAYEWLVVSGAKARYRGTGTVNGTGSYGFELTAWDGQISGGGGVDRFRIKIWNQNQGNGVVYDNMMNEPDGADPTTSLGGGSIVIHKSGSNLVLNAAANGTPSGKTRLTDSQLSTGLADAIAEWVAQGLSPSQLQDLQGLTVSVADLPGNHLGLASESTNYVWIDADAAGYGWSFTTEDLRLGRVDLLSVLTHELGHKLGYEHDVMGESLNVGERHLAMQRDRVIPYYAELGKLVTNGLGTLIQPKFNRDADFNLDIRGLRSSSTEMNDIVDRSLADWSDDNSWAIGSNGYSILDERQSLRERKTLLQANDKLDEDLLDELWGNADF